MAVLPIKGRGLDAIIRNTTDSDITSDSLPATPEEMARLISWFKDEFELARLGDGSIETGSDENLAELYSKAENFEKKKNPLDAFHLYRRIIRIDRKNIAALYRIATIYYSAGLLSKTISALTALVELDPDNKRAKASLKAIQSSKL